MEEEEEEVRFGSSDFNFPAGVLCPVILAADLFSLQTTCSRIPKLGFLLTF